jgi:hypothetical protein
MRSSTLADEETHMITAWSRGAAARNDVALTDLRPAPAGGRLPIAPDARFQRATLDCPGESVLVFEITCPRPLRLWLDGQPILDEPLFWRFYQRKMRVVAFAPARKGTLDLLAEFGERPRHPAGVDRDCPSRNRAAVMSALAERFPEILDIQVRALPGLALPPFSLCFTPTQFHRDGVTWQEIQGRLMPDWSQPPTPQALNTCDTLPAWPLIEAADWPGQVHEATTDDDRRAGVRRLCVPIGATGAQPPLRQPGPDPRPEPEIEVAATASLRIEGAAGDVRVPFPVFESLGRHAPRREWREVTFPADADALLRVLPRPIVPAKWAHLEELWQASWRMLVGLVRTPRREGGLPNSYVTTAMDGFRNVVFVWDSSFTALAYAYGWRHFPYTATLDMLYSRQFDGGYLHREHETTTGLPILYEPDFSPNPPLPAVVELQFARLTGGLGRLRQVQPLLTSLFEWLDHNRRLPDGTYWTTGLANGLDNSPSLGDGYPCLTAQMAHFAGCLAEMAAMLGQDDNAKGWRARHAEIGRALNATLWSEDMKFYSTSLPDGQHNPNKVATGFWPLWAGVVPPERVEHLARHLKCPSSFWRHHPVPSLAADSPAFRAAGDYWLGSTWAPTNCAAIKGFQQAGRLDLARELTHRHLDVMGEVLRATGHIWENYCSEQSARGSWSTHDYSWTAVGPIALLMEVVLGIEPDAVRRRLRWTPPAGERVGVERFPLGTATLRLEQQPGPKGDKVLVDTDRPFTLELVQNGKTREIPCAAGRTEVTPV